MATPKNNRATLSVRQLAQRWGVGEGRIRTLIETGHLSAFTVPAAGAYGETVRISLQTVEEAEKLWMNQSSATPRRSKRSRNSKQSRLTHFPEFSRGCEGGVELRADGSH